MKCLVFFIVKAEQLFGRGFSVLVVSLDFMIIALLCFFIDLLDWVVNKISIVSVFFKNQRDHFLFHFLFGVKTACRCCFLAGNYLM